MSVGLYTKQRYISIQINRASPEFVLSASKQAGEQYGFDGRIPQQHAAILVVTTFVHRNVEDCFCSL